MKLARSTYYYRSRRQTIARNAVEQRIARLCAELPRYGYRRITAQLRTEGVSINHKAVARIIPERDLQVRPLRRFVRTTDREHDGARPPRAPLGQHKAGWPARRTARRPRIQNLNAFHLRPQTRRRAETESCLLSQRNGSRNALDLVQFGAVNLSSPKGSLQLAPSL